MGYAGPISREQTAEELLLEFERTGRPEPFEEVVRRYSGMVFHVCYRITRDRHDAEDATQAVFAALAVGRKKEGGEIRTVGPWLRQVARRTSLDIRRGKKRRERRETLCASDGSVVAPTPEPAKGGVDAEELKQFIRDELEKLPVKYRLPLVLHYFGGMTQDDMAKELGCRPGTLRVRLHRGRNMLAKRLAKRGIAVGAVVFAVAITRAVQSAVTHSLSVHYGFGHATASAGVLQASSAPVTVLQGVAASKIKVACAVVLLGACVVRAGAEVFDYIRPLQMRLPIQLDLDRLVRPIVDPFLQPFRVDARPVQPSTTNLVPIVNLPPHQLEPRSTPVALVPAPVIPSVHPTVATNVPAAPNPTNDPRQQGGNVVSAALRQPGQISPGYTRASTWSIPATPSSDTGRATGWASTVAPSPWSGTFPSNPILNVSRPTTPTVPVTPPSTLTPDLPNPLATNVTPVTPNKQSVPLPGTSTPSPLAGTLTLHATPAGILPSRTVASAGGLQALHAGDNWLVSSDSITAAPGSTQQDFQLLTWSANNYSRVATAYITGSVTNNQPPYQVTDNGLIGQGVVTGSAVLDNSGVVTATANFAQPANLDLSQFGAITNTVDNPPNGRNGWYVYTKGKLVLPKIPVAAGTHAYSWAENPDDPSPDLVNSLRVTLHDVVAAGNLDIALVSPDRPEVPTLPAGEQVVSLWSMATNADAVGGIDLLIRFDAIKTHLLGGEYGDIRLLEYDNAWRAIDDDTFAVDTTNFQVTGHVRGATYFAISLPPATVTQYSVALPATSVSPTTITPEPTIGFALATSGLLLLRRRRTKI